MEIALLFLAFLILLLFGLPIALSVGASSVIYLLLNDIPLSVVPRKMFTGVDSFVLLCVPGFILAGSLMNSGGITRRLIRFSNALIGHIKGGLAQANVLASMFFAGITGTAIADTVSIGAVMIPAMKDEGYDTDFAVGVTVSSSTIGPIIPPSLPMIIAGTMTGLSVTKLFVGGALPGLLLGLALMGVSYIIARKKNYPKEPRASSRVLLRTFIEAFWALMLTVIILLGILGGIVTPTEASIIAGIYAFIVGLFVYRELKIRDVPGIILSTMKSSASILILVGFARVFGWILASEQIPQLLAKVLLSITDNMVLLLLIINVLLLFVGMFMETIAALVILFPVLLPVAAELGMDPIHFGVMVVLNLMIGLTTPPIGVCLFAGAGIGKITIVEASRGVLPFLLVSLGVLMIVTYIPQVTLFLPGLLQ